MALTDLSGGTAGGGGGIDSAELISAEIVVYHTIDLTDVMNKYFNIAVAPGQGAKLKIYTIGGTTLEHGVDYLVDVGNLRVTWDGLGLDGLVAAGDKFQLVYLTTA